MGTIGSIAILVGFLMVHADASYDRLVVSGAFEPEGSDSEQYWIDRCKNDDPSVAPVFGEGC